jgi:hypothetical protein
MKGKKQMAENEKILETIIVLRTDTKTAWETDNSYKLREGEVGVGYMPIYDDEGNIVKNATIIKVGAKDANGNLKAWKDLPQAEGVFEKDLTLTRTFGRHDASKGPINAGGKGMTTSEWLINALSEIFSAKVTSPSTSVTLKGIDSKGNAINNNSSVEIGTKIDKISWTGSFSAGSYGKNDNDKSSKTTYGTVGYPTSNATGLSAANHITGWSTTYKLPADSDYSANAVAAQNSSSSNHFDITDFTVTSTGATSIATVKQTCKYTTTAAAAVRTPLTNVGDEDPDNKIDATPKDPNFTATSTYKLSGYYKPFWGHKLTADALANPDAITSAQVRALGNSGSSTGGLPTTLNVPAGTKQIFFAAKAGTKSSLAIKNTTKEPATSVACTKKAALLVVNGANDYNHGESYDVWYVNLDAAFTGATSLTLTWA